MVILSTGGGQTFNNLHNMRWNMPRKIALKNLQTTNAIMMTEYHMVYANSVDRTKEATKTVYIRFSNN